MDDTEQMWSGFWQGLFVILTLVALFTVMTLYSGWVVWLLWNWHAGPFTDIKLTLAQTIGATTLLSCLKGFNALKDPPPKSIRKWLAYVTLALLIGWIAHIYA